MLYCSVAPLKRGVPEIFVVPVRRLLQYDKDTDSSTFWPTIVFVSDGVSQLRNYCIQPMHRLLFQSTIVFIAYLGHGMNCSSGYVKRVFS